MNDLLAGRITLDPFEEYSSRWVPPAGTLAGRGWNAGILFNLRDQFEQFRQRPDTFHWACATDYQMEAMLELGTRTWVWTQQSNRSSSEPGAARFNRVSRLNPFHHLQSYFRETVGSTSSLGSSWWEPSLHVAPEVHQSGLGWHPCVCG